MKGITHRNTQCLHKIIKLASHQKCLQRAMICSQNCQYKQLHLSKGDHPTLPVDQFVFKVKQKRGQIEREGLKCIAYIEQQYKQTVHNMKIKKQECQQNIKELIKFSGYSDKYLTGIQKVQNQRYQSLICKQVFQLLKFQPLLTKKVQDQFHKIVKQFQNCKFKNSKIDQVFNAEFIKKGDVAEFIKKGDVGNKKIIKQQKINQKQKQKYQIIRQSPQIIAPSYLLQQDKLNFENLISKNQELQIQLRKAQNRIKLINRSKNIENNYSNSDQNKCSSSQSVVQIKNNFKRDNKNNRIDNHNQAVLKMIQKYKDKKLQLNLSQNKNNQLELSRQKIIVQNSFIPSVYKPQQTYKMTAYNTLNLKQNKQSINSQMYQKKKEQIKQKQAPNEQKKIIYASNIKNISSERQQKQKIKVKEVIISNQNAGKDKVQKSIQRQAQKRVQLKMATTYQQQQKINKSKKANQNEIIKQEYEEGEIYKYYDSQNKQAYTSTQKLKQAGSSLQNMIKLQLTHPIPSIYSKPRLSLKQIPKLSESNQRITSLNYATVKIPTVDKLSQQINRNQKIKIVNGNVQNNNNVRALQSHKPVLSQKQAQNQKITFLNKQPGVFKPPPMMMFNDPTMKAQKKFDISKVFEKQEQSQKIKQLERQNQSKIRFQMQEKQKRKAEQQKEKKIIEEKNRQEALKKDQQINQRLIQSLITQTNAFESTPNCEDYLLQVPKLKNMQENITTNTFSCILNKKLNQQLPKGQKEEKQLKQIEYQNDTKISIEKNYLGSQAMDLEDEQMKMEQQKQKNLMDEQDQSVSDSFQI